MYHFAPKETLCRLFFTFDMLQDIHFKDSVAYYLQSCRGFVGSVDYGVNLCVAFKKGIIVISSKGFLGIRRGILRQTPISRHILIYVPLPVKGYFFL